MNHRAWSEGFAVMLFIVTIVLWCAVDRNEALERQVAAKSPVEEHCVAALASCNRLNETRRKK